MGRSQRHMFQEQGVTASGAHISMLTGGGSPPPVQETPVISSLEPAEAELGSADVTMHVRGEKFTAESVIMFAGQPEPIVFIDATDITTVVKPSLGWGAVTVQVEVMNGDLISNSVGFTFTEAVVDDESAGRKKKR